MLKFSTDHSAADLSVPTVIITAGLPAAGKSSLCEHLWPELPTLDCDELKKDHPDFDPKRPELVHAWSAAEFDKRRVVALGSGVTHILDSTATNIEKVAGWVAEAHGAGFRVHLLMVTCTTATSIARNAARERTVPVHIIEAKSKIVRESFAALTAIADSSETINNN
jgi:predicted kinase